ncbi:Xaa-Pro dipeptidyl-peptidase [Chengkuizengella sediminis]|uniref:Xaa-Pro dipeptidyl-peptidase n=1 Tax=Chengkuizengella sediminis TaxID=1885917 RepID=UPI001389FF96|nr:Xaa-Pro dipeptidyl-peptidase [Chengkuizengella sediminis]NDI35892.1 Xaa-Pro dipeptidyl-peptidase [Chengkuizengella sediminis]
MSKKNLVMIFSTIVVLVFIMLLSIQSLNINGNEQTQEDKLKEEKITDLNIQTEKESEQTTNMDNVEIQVSENKTQPAYSYSDAIIESVFVETTVDSDNDGNFDRIHANIIRPKETEDGLKVPVIYEITPYMYGLNPLTFHEVNVELNAVDENGKAKGRPFSGPEELDFPGTYDDYFVPHGYAVVIAEGIGTALSEGCPTIGDENEVLAASSVIDWLNGRAKAFSEDGQLVSADWATGNVGMIGMSYNGTLDNGVAVTGIEGLKTIVPIAAISSWYDYYRANGAVVAPGGYQGEDTDILADAILTRENPEVCNEVVNELEHTQDRVTGDYNEFWDDRNYLNEVKNINASVFVVHGLNDWNVKTKQFSQWWDALGKNDVPRKLWLHQDGHKNPKRIRENEWYETLHKWFDYWLYEIDNGIMDEPMVDIQREDSTWKIEDNWPAEGAVSTTLYLNHDPNIQTGMVSLQSSSNNQKNSITLIDDPMVQAEVLVANPEESNPNRIVFMTNELVDSVRISGTPEVSIRASLDQPVSNLTAILVDYSKTSSKIVTRGWMDPQNINDVNKSKPLDPNQNYTFTWDMQPDDYVFEKGHRIGIVFIASDFEYTLRPPAGKKLTLFPEKSKVILPIVGGSDALKW